MNLRRRHSRGPREGTAVIVVIALLALLLVFVAGNARTLNHLSSELRLLDQVQRLRLEHYRTNVVATSPITPARVGNETTNAAATP